MSSTLSVKDEGGEPAEGGAPLASASEAEPVAATVATTVPTVSAASTATPPAFGASLTQPQAPPPAISIGSMNPNQQIPGLTSSAPRLPPATPPPSLGGGLMLQPPSIGERGPVMASEPSPLLGQQQGPLGGGISGGGPAAPPGPPQPYRQLKVEDALAYLDKVKMKFDKQPHIYNQFLDIMKEFKAQSIDTPGVIDRVLQLFHGHRELILGFNTFLPPGYKIEFSDDENKPRVQLKYPHGMTGPQPQGAYAHGVGGPPPAPAPVPQAPPVGLPSFQTLPTSAPELQPPPAPTPATQTAQQKKAPIEFDQAINYVTKIKTRFGKQPETYKAFLEILHTYQKEQKTIKEVYEQVSTLFKNHTDLLSEFSQFLPDGSPEATNLLAQGPKAQKSKAIAGISNMPHPGLKQPVAQRPAAKQPTRPQTDEEEERFWQKRKPVRKEDGKRPEGQTSRSPEAEFFSKCRNRMPKPLYLELLKCLNLYSQQILDRSELLTLVHDLFKRSQIELFTAFRRLLGYSTGERDAPSPQTSRAPVAEGGNFRDLDFSSMKRHGTSYRILPDSYPMPTTSGRGPLETLVLNDSWVSVATGTEDLNFKTMRKNQYEESIFRAEDERFEMDTTIETNKATLQMLQPIQQDMAGLSESEKRRFKLPQPLSAMHCKSIRRLYGAQGTQVIELLNKCPAAAIGALIKRMQQKDEEWRSLRTQCAKGWKEVYEKNYTKSLDHRSFYFKQGDKRNFSGKQMVMELKGLTESDEGGDGAAPPPEGSDGSLSLKLTCKGCLQALHTDSLKLMTFAAKLSFSVVEGEIEEKLSHFWETFVRRFFACADLEPDDSKGATMMELDDCTNLGHKPLLIASPDPSEEQATREARPPESRWSMPLSYPKTSAQLFIGNSHFYIFVRLYHIIMERLGAAKEMAAAAKEEAAAISETENGDKDAAALPAAQQNGLGGAAGDAMSRAALLESLRKESKGDLYVAFTMALYQLVEGKMEASVYEDVLRTLLGTNAYTLFTLHKIISQALKQLQLLLVEETSQKLLQLYVYESYRVNAGSMSEATYRTNARLLLEGDDCFRMEQLYSAGGGELVMSFLPEKEVEENDGEEDEEDEDEDEETEVETGDWSAYMDSFVQTSCGRSPPKGSHPVLLRTLGKVNAVSWDKAVLLNGLECRAQVGGWKLRFVTRSEDVWYSNVRRNPAKRAAASSRRNASKRQRLQSIMDARQSEAGVNAVNALAGMGAPQRAPLPSAHKLRPLDQ
ncbi:hypothetical protein AB1Y20_019359 [Prymnesium parvum]|uniref:Histone deacetylase interacting domain-containing protein n=1 Tax=Prymnesium parvum TaxID=97485 RepID=A0AB34JSG0_PRYPA